LRLCLFTDTLGDINGVSRFIRDIADQALESSRDLTVLTSTRFEIPGRPNLLNFPPPAAMRIPRYRNLEVVLPPLRPLLRAAGQFRPDAIHISTPGPVGWAGRVAARRLRIPLLGVYHTDFPAYIQRLFNDDPLTDATESFMAWFYRPFSAVFTRSADYADSIARLGIPRHRITRLRPGINTALFAPEHRDDGVWRRLGVPSTGVKVIYCGRVSVEKNLPLLCRTWKTLKARLSAGEAQLIIVGDGPYRAEMERELSGHDTHFLGFRHGQELSALYASADLCVFPSTTDTLGQVVMEAQSSGLPVLVTDKGGPKEVVQHQRTGLVLPHDRPGAWADAIIGLIRDHERRRAIGAAATASIAPMTIRASFDHWWAVHESACAKREAGDNPAPVRAPEPALI
jgi:glycosyltransferase involved in cell wall biosynthesis